MAQEQQFQSTAFLLYHLLWETDELIEILESPPEPLLPVPDLDIIIAEYRIIRQIISNAYNQLIEEWYPRDDDGNPLFL